MQTCPFLWNRSNSKVIILHEYFVLLFYLIKHDYRCLRNVFVIWFLIRKSGFNQISLELNGGSRSRRIPRVLPWEGQWFSRPHCERYRPATSIVLGLKTHSFFTKGFSFTSTLFLLFCVVDTIKIQKCNNQCYTC